MVYTIAMYINLLGKVGQPLEVTEYNTKAFKLYSGQGSGSAENKHKHKINRQPKNTVLRSSLHLSENIDEINFRNC